MLSLLVMLSLSRNLRPCKCSQASDQTVCDSSADRRSNLFCTSSISACQLGKVLRKSLDTASKQATLAPRCQVPSRAGRSPIKARDTVGSRQPNFTYCTLSRSVTVGPSSRPTVPEPAQLATFEAAQGATPVGRCCAPASSNFLSSINLTYLTYTNSERPSDPGGENTRLFPRATASGSLPHEGAEKG